MDEPQRCSVQTKAGFKGSQWLKYWWILMFSSYSKRKTSDKAMRCRDQRWKSLSATVFHSLSPFQICSLRRELVCGFRGGTGQGARQSQALTKSGSTRFNPRAEWQGHFLLSPLPLQDRAQLFLVPPGRAKMNRTFQHRVAQKWGSHCWQPKEVPCHNEQNQERWELGRKTQQHILQRIQDIRRIFMLCFSAHQTFHSCHWEPTGTDKNLNLSLSLS